MSDAVSSGRPRESTLVAELSAAMAPDRVRGGPLELTLYRRDASLLEGQPGVVCFPRTTEELVELDDDGLCCGAGGAYAGLHPGDSSISPGLQPDG